MSSADPPTEPARHRVVGHAGSNPSPPPRRSMLWFSGRWPVPIERYMRRSPAHRLVPIAFAVGCAIAAFFLLASVHAFERFSAFAERHESWQLDDAAVVAVLAAILGAVVLAFRRGRALAAVRAKQEEAAPVPAFCAVCDRDELGNVRLPPSGAAAPNESTAFTHTVCAACLAVLKQSPAPVA